MVPLFILNPVPVIAGETPREALRKSLALAQRHSWHHLARIRKAIGR
jgi:hypothetical protein